ncbi:MAG: MotA/TolQ/ExbB proton channel family protein [Pirellulales bacterium]
MNSCRKGLAVVVGGRRRIDPRSLWMVLVVSIPTAFVLWAGPVWGPCTLIRSGLAQPPDPEIVADEEEAAPDIGAVAGPGDNGGNGVASAGSAGQDSQSITVLSWAFESLGWSYSIIFLSLSFTLVALFVMNVLTARRENVLPSDLTAQFEQRLNERQYQEAYELAKQDESFLGRVLSAGLAKLSVAGYGQAIEAMQEVGEEENMKLDHRLSYMALIGTISPMIGLLGTVHGMILSFQIIATSTTAPKPAELAKGIATALFTTLVGLFIAIPAIAAYNILRNRIARLVLEVGIESDALMSRFQNVGTRRPGAAPPQAAGTQQPGGAQQAGPSISTGPGGSSPSPRGGGDPTPPPQQPS